jgi:hypothetical protein
MNNNRWEDPSRKAESSCYCTNDYGLFIPSRQLSFIVAALLFFTFFIFMTGYFLGKKNVVEQFVEQAQQEACADTIYSHLMSNNEDSEQPEPAPLALAQIEESEVAISSLNQKISDMQDELTVQQEQEISELYYAQLIGFGTEKAAQIFVKKLETKGIATEIKKRASKTAKGRTSCWYQVVTLNYGDKSELIKLVDRITKEENIKDAVIRAC